ncbi:hypothetical protein QJS10_CPA02g00843 [Acorus calamus]|uniref:Tuftelin interacting protein N-terminal domain-containing protein n=1 Tax=Acorus calamus TaxID=4465 RepID=A0AAV9FEJ2_ACOCL|nr:hypothetical protein QJS10_CPA02g00843 [Acorus calamus]
MKTLVVADPSLFLSHLRRRRPPPRLVHQTLPQPPRFIYVRFILNQTLQNPKKKRETNRSSLRQTKDDPLYGIFLGSSFDDEDRRSGKHGRRGRRDLDDDLPKSASTFVSSGTVDQLDPPPLDQPVRTVDHDACAVKPRSNMLEERRL